MRRFAPGFSPIVAFEDVANPDFRLLEKYSLVGESFYCDQWRGATPEGWGIEVEGLMLKMVWDGPVLNRTTTLEYRQLGPEDAEAALDLAARTQPGPFGIRTLELGDYFGIFEGDRLVSMAGERLWAGPYREISGVCTDPDFQGRGYAKVLMTNLIRNSMTRGEIPVLHVMSANELARGLYRRLGFREYLETVVRVIRREP